MANHVSTDHISTSFNMNTYGTVVELVAGAGLIHYRAAALGQGEGRPTHGQSLAHRVAARVVAGAGALEQGQHRERRSGRIRQVVQRCLSHAVMCHNATGWPVSCANTSLYV